MMWCLHALWEMLSQVKHKKSDVLTFSCSFSKITSCWSEGVFLVFQSSIWSHPTCPPYCVFFAFTNIKCETISLEIRTELWCCHSSWVSTLSALGSITEPPSFWGLRRSSLSLEPFCCNLQSLERMWWLI